ncbi:hypothetical protein [Photobacterium sanguinicancri]|uniref:hypothetical protein n=1 Tax=Photobacterium sanguinicancri TaxID=875932 RepID=UPI0021C2CD08|nr:hypothetical protein [Photobacterium sanguinicancri]
MMEMKMLKRNISYMERELSEMKKELAMLEESDFQSKKLDTVFKPESLIASELSVVD